MEDQRRRLRERVARLAQLLGPALTAEAVLVGGCAPALYDLGDLPIRATKDVDLVFPDRTFLESQRRQNRVVEAGFRSCVGEEEDAPICRYRHKTERDICIDIAAIGDVGQVTNPFYRYAFDAPLTAASFRVVDPLVFVGTKFEAFFSRGVRDPLSSHDLEDIVLVLRTGTDLTDAIADGATNLASEVRTHGGVLRTTERP